MPALPLVELSPIVIGLVALGLAIMTTLLIRATLGKLSAAASHLPGIGSWLSGAIDAVAAAITSVLGNAEAGIDKLLGTMFHLLAEQFNWLWREFTRHTLVGQLLSTLVYSLTHAFSGLKSQIHSLGKAGAVANATVKRLDKEYHGIEHRVKTLERDVAKGIGHDLRIQVAGLERDLTHVENVVVPGLRTAVNTAEGDVISLRKWIATNFPAVGTEAFAGAVAVALAALGLSGLRCNSLLNSLKNRGCGLWSGLEDLLGLFVDTLLLTNVCTILPFLETAVSDVADPIVIALTDVGAGLCHGGIGAAPALQVPALSLPANPGVTLNLP